MVKIYFSLRDLIEQQTTRESTWLLRSPSLASLMATDKEQEKAIWDIVDFIISRGGNHIEANLEELYKRVAFNICIGNTDDHFRNHSFLLGKEGWELSPAYDMNPTNGIFQALLIDTNTNDSLSIAFTMPMSFICWMKQPQEAL